MVVKPEQKDQTDCVGHNVDTDSRSSNAVTNPVRKVETCRVFCKGGVRIRIWACSGCVRARVEKKVEVENEVVVCEVGGCEDEGTGYGWGKPFRGEEDNDGGVVERSASLLVPMSSQTSPGRLVKRVDQ